MKKEKSVILFNTALTQLATCSMSALVGVQKKQMKDLVATLKLMKVEAPLKIIDKISADIVELEKELLEVKVNEAYNFITKKYADELKEHEESLVLLDGIKAAVPLFSPAEMATIVKHITMLVTCAKAYVKDSK